MKIVKVEWVDSYSTDSWVSNDDVIKEMGYKYVMTTVGYLFKTTKDGVIICQSYNDTMVSGLLHIPKECIKKIETIKNK